MTRDDIIRLAQKAGIDFDLIDEDEGRIWYITAQGLERFAAIVAAAEREAVSEEYSMCLQSDLEHGVKCLNIAAWDKFKAEYPQLSGFSRWLSERGNNEN